MYACVCMHVHTHVHVCLCVCMRAWVCICLSVLFLINEIAQITLEKSREQPMIYSLFLFSHISKLNKKGRNVMTGGLTHMGKFQTIPHMPRRNPVRSGRRNTPGQGLLSALETSFPLNLSCTDNELPASTITGTITTHNPRGHPLVKTLTLPGIEAGRKLLTVLRLLIINPSHPQLH